MVKTIREILDNGIIIDCKKNQHYTSFKFIDEKGKTVRATYKHTTQKEIGATFDLLPYTEYGDIIHLTEQEAEKRHAGSVRYIMKLNKAMTEKEVLDDILIPAIIKAGLKNNGVYASNGVKPFEWKHGPLIRDGVNPFEWKHGPFLKDCYFYSFTNKSGNTWVAYINYKSGDIWISSNDHLINWKWKKFIEDTTTFSSSWEMTTPEQEWLTSLLKMANTLRDVRKDFSKVEKN